jgi:hypothetical protein
VEQQQIDNVATDLSELKVSTEGGEEKTTQPSDEGRPSTKPANGETTDAADAGAEQSTEAEAATTDEAGGLLPSPAPAQDPSAYAADPTNFEIKHPLQNRWSLWYDNPRKRTSADTWGNHLKHVVEFDTVRGPSPPLPVPNQPIRLPRLSNLLRANFSEFPHFL